MLPFAHARLGYDPSAPMATSVVPYIGPVGSSSSQGATPKRKTSPTAEERRREKERRMEEREQKLRDGFERKQREREEKDRRVAEERARKLAEKEEQKQREREEKERIATVERERKIAEKQREREEKERIATVERERKLAEKQRERQERERLTAERDAEKQRVAMEEKERKRMEREERDRLVAEGKAQKREQKDQEQAAEKLRREQEARERQYKVTMIRRVKEERTLTRQFPGAFQNVTCGLTPDDGFTFAELESLPVGSMETLIKDDHPRDVLVLAMRAFDAQVKRFRLWETDGGVIMRQGTPGFNAKTTEVLNTLHVTGARECNKVRSDGTREPMLHQATARALLHPLTPVSRALIIHPTGTGKSFVMINTLDNFFYDTRDKVIVVPSYVVQLQIVQDMIQLLPSDRPLKRWYIKWRSGIVRTAETSTDKLNPTRIRLLEALRRYETGADPIRGDSDYLWYVVAALSFQTMLTRSASTDGGQGSSSRPKRSAEDDEDDIQDGYDKESEEADVKVPEMFPDRERLKVFEAMRQASTEETDLWELRSRIVFMTYQDHKLGFYRNHPVFSSKSGRAPSVSFNDKIVLVDEMHNLFDERNPNLNRVQQRKIFGDKVYRSNYEQRLKLAIECRDKGTSCREDSKTGEKKIPADSDIRKLKEAVLIFSGMKKVMQKCSKCVLIGLTATPIVEGDGARAAVQILNWIRGSSATSKRVDITEGGAESDDAGAQSDAEENGAPPVAPPEEAAFMGSASRYRAAGTSTDPPSSPVRGGESPTARKKKGMPNVDLGQYEGFVSVFGVKPTQLFARADETSYPNLIPILTHVSPEFLEPGRAKRKEDDDNDAVLEEEEEGKESNAIPTYGLGRLQSLIAKYQVAKRAEQWFEDQSDAQAYAPTKKSDDIEYWERSRAWTSNPMLFRTETEMPRWSQDGLRPFGRSPPRVGSCVWLERASKKDSTSWRDTRQPCWVRSTIAFSQLHPVKLDESGTLSRDDVVGRNGSVDLEIGNLDKRLVLRDAVEGITIHKDHVMVKTSKATHKMYIFDAPLKKNTRRAFVEVTRKGSKHSIEAVSGDEDPEFYVIRNEGQEEFTVANLSTVTARRETQNLDYTADYLYYEESQLRVLYPRRLAEYKQDEGSYWMNVFYGGRQLRAAQASAVLAEGTRVGGIQDENVDVSGFAIDMARHIVKDAFARKGKTLWLLHEAHGLALVRRWLESADARRVGDTSRIILFGSYRNEDKVPVQRAVKSFLETTYNAASNVEGDVCKLLIGGAGDLGVGVTFTEVRHIYLDLTSSYFSIVQQMGRGQRLCKHVRLPDSERTLTFHLPIPLMTLGWGAPAVNATVRTSPGGIGTVTAEMEDFVSKYKFGTRRETISAPLHVPLHALDSLNDLQRARFQFYAGMQIFQDVAMDGDYYRRVAGWEPTRIDLETEPIDRSKVTSMVRDLVKRSLYKSPFIARGITTLEQKSRDNERANQEAADHPPNDDDRERRSTHNPERMRYLEELAVRQGKLQKKEMVAQKKEDKQQQKVMKEVKKHEDAVAKRNCANYEVKGFGTIVRRDRPDEKVNQAQAIKMILDGSKEGDPHCQVLHSVLKMLDVL